jgi:hypothetical protein
MPAEVAAAPAGIVCLFSDGRRSRHVVAGEPAGLVADLLAGLAGLVHPHGLIDSPDTVATYVRAAADLAGFADRRGVVGGAEGLGRGLLAEYWMQAGREQESATRRMLVGFDEAGGGRRLQPGARALAGGRLFSSRPARSPLTPYTQAQWQRLHQVVRGIADQGYAAHRAALAGAGRGRDPREHGWSMDNQLWLLAQVGPASEDRIGRLIGRHGGWVNKHGGTRGASSGLFPDADVVVAYQLLLGMYCGVVPDGIADLGVGDLDWAGRGSVLLGYLKGRTGPESLTLPGRAVRLLEQWLDHSAAAREHVPAGLRDSLWIYYAYNSAPGWRTPTTTVRFRWARRHGLEEVDRRRIRTTYLSLRDRRSWQGSARSTIDPNHTPAVEGDHYLTAATPAQMDAVEQVIEDAQRDMLARAHPPVVLPDAAAADLAVRFPHQVAGLGLHDATIGELVGGAQDVFVAACTDLLSGLHGPAGKPCPARPWVCLLCPLAVFTPRHAPNLLRLKGFFSQQWDQMPAAHFMAVFGPYVTAVVAVLDRYDTAVLAAAHQALADAGERDHDAGLPLRPEETTT